MYIHRFKLKKWLAVFLTLAAFATPSISTAQPVELEVNIDDIGIEPGLLEIKIPVYVINYTDSILGFEMMVLENRPDVTVFDWQIDTVGTLIGGWEYVNSQNFDGWNTNVLIIALADLYDPPERTPGIPPQAGETPLLYLQAYIYELDDTLPDQTVTYFLNKIYPFCPLFANQWGQNIGVEPDIVCDSVYFQCVAWVEDICLEWQKVPYPPYDSAAYECENVLVLDTNAVKLKNGSLTVMLSTCGDINGNGELDIADITALISYLYLHGDPPPVMRVANINGSLDGVIDITDVTYIISALYIDHREMVCPYIPPVE